MKMEYLSGSEIRRKYLDFFVKHGHLELESASLIPKDDPSLLMIGAGMAPFKAYFTGKVKPPCPRITTSQRCVRTGDIENVGKTARHHTYFEMLGNFSFGDYFKYDAIKWAWDFLTNDLKLPKEKLWVSIYPDDKEAYKYWTEETDVDKDHIVALKDNFWEIGQGPCGPDSEIFIDLGKDRGCDSPSCGVGCDCDRYLEIWNLVFTQFDKTADGEYVPLQNKNIDTGCGLERLASVLQNVPSNFETDLMFPIIEYAAKVSNQKYGVNQNTDISLKVIADHARSISFMVMDGILPSNEGRGYVLRRLLRRAIRHARMLGIEEKFLAGAVDVVANIYKDVYTELETRKDYIKKIISLEEERFHTTLNQGLALLNSEIENLIKEDKKVLAGNIGFKLYDTFGFPKELTEEILHEQNLELDNDAFISHMEEQRQRARAARSENTKLDLPDLRNINTENLKIDETATLGKVVCIWQDGEIVKEIHDSHRAGIILDINPFYPEGGGQAGDIGYIKNEYGVTKVLDTKKFPDGTVYNIVEVLEGCLRIDDNVEILVDFENKLSSSRNHTATHMLQAALKKVVGEHITQAGSFVNADYLRFDFSSFNPITKEELAQIENLVNAEIFKAQDVEVLHMELEEAKKAGAMALFGEKYGDEVRVVSIPNFSMELCGGCHVKNVGEIGLFKIISESSVASGVRRIEAITGKKALEYLNQKADILKTAIDILKCKEDNFVNKVAELQKQNKDLEKELNKIKTDNANNLSKSLLENAILLEDIKIITTKLENTNVDDMKIMADSLVDSLGENSVVVLAGTSNDKLFFITKAGKGANKKGVHAGKVVKEIAILTGGNGGGRPDMAQAGGKDITKVDSALNESINIIKSQIK